MNGRGFDPVVPVWMHTVLLGWLLQPWLCAVTVTLYVCPQSRPGNRQEDPVELHVFTSPVPLVAVATYSSTFKVLFQDTVAELEPHCRSAYTC